MALDQQLYSRLAQDIANSTTQYVPQSAAQQKADLLAQRSLDKKRQLDPMKSLLDEQEQERIRRSNLLAPSTFDQGMQAVNAYKSNVLEPAGITDPEYQRKALLAEGLGVANPTEDEVALQQNAQTPGYELGLYAQDGARNLLRAQEIVNMPDKGHSDNWLRIGKESVLDTMYKFGQEWSDDETETGTGKSSDMYQYFEGLRKDLKEEVDADPRDEARGMLMMEEGFKAKDPAMMAEAIAVGGPEVAIRSVGTTGTQTVVRLAAASAVAGALGAAGVTGGLATPLIAGAIGFMVGSSADTEERLRQRQKNNGGKENSAAVIAGSYAVGGLMLAFETGSLKFGITGKVPMLKAKVKGAKPSEIPFKEWLKKRPPSMKKELATQFVAAPARILGAGLVEVGQETFTETVRILNEELGTDVDAGGVYKILTSQKNQARLKEAAAGGAIGGTATATPGRTAESLQSIRKTGNRIGEFNTQARNTQVGFATEEDKAKNLEFLGKKITNDEAIYTELQDIPNKVKSILASDMSDSAKISEVSSILPKNVGSDTDSDSSVHNFGIDRVNKTLDDVFSDPEIGPLLNNDSFKNKIIGQINNLTGKKLTKDSDVRESINEFVQEGNANKAMDLLLTAVKSTGQPIPDTVKASINSTITDLRKEASDIIKSGALDTLSYNTALSQIGTSAGQTQAAVDAINKSKELKSEVTKTTKKIARLKKLFNSSKIVGELGNYNEAALKDLETRLDAEMKDATGTNLKEASSLMDSIKKAMNKPATVKEAQKVKKAIQQVRSARKQNKAVYDPTLTPKQWFDKVVKAGKDKFTKAVADSEQATDLVNTVAANIDNIQSINPEEVPVVKDAVEALTKAGKLTEKKAKEYKKVIDDYIKANSHVRPQIKKKFDEILELASEATSKVLNSAKGKTKADVVKDINSFIDKSKDKLNAKELSTLASIISTLKEAGTITKAQADSTIDSLKETAKSESIKDMLDTAKEKIIDLTSKESRDSAYEAVSAATDKVSKSEFGKDVKNVSERVYNKVHEMYDNFSVEDVIEKGKSKIEALNMDQMYVDAKEFIRMEKEGIKMKIMECK